MATSMLFSHLRRSRASSLLPTLSAVRLSHFLPNRHPNPIPLFLPPHPSHTRKPLAFLHLLLARPFSSRSADADHSEFGRISGDSAADPATELELINVGLGGEVPQGLPDVTVDESILPVRAMISMLDGFHDFTGLPWWIVIASSTLALRVALLPVLILQLNKLKKIGDLFPKLPPPLPPPLSGRSYIDQISLFRKERRAIGCPSFLWFLSYFSIQVPCFFLWMTSVRRMSLDHHPGFDCLGTFCTIGQELLVKGSEVRHASFDDTEALFAPMMGGALWFQNLTEFPHGISGPIFPLLIAGLHYANVQVSFGATSVGKMTGVFGLLAKYYKFYLEFLTLPLFFIGYCIPQGSLVYWLTNSSLTIIQQLSLRHPAVRAKLGLPDKGAPTAAGNSGETAAPGITSTDSPTKQRQISVKNLHPKELLALSVQLLSNGKKERAIPLLRLALDKDPEYVRALIVMGQTLLQNGQPAEATEYLERAISKLFLAGDPTEAEYAELLILSSQWAGVACLRQGKSAEGMVHLERVGRLKEPEEARIKAHYFDGIVLLASALYNEGRKAEAANYLRMAAAYNPAYNEYLEQCENDEDNFVSDLTSSRRKDY